MKEISVLLVDNNERFLMMAKEYIGEQDFVKEVFVTPNDAETMRLAAEKKAGPDPAGCAHAGPQRH